MKADNIKYGAIAYTGLKFVQQTAGELARIFTRDSKASLLSFGTGEIARIGGSITAGYTLEEVLNGFERIVVPKSFQGLLTAGAATLGVGAISSYYGSYFDIPKLEEVGNIPNVLEQGKAVMENTGIIAMLSQYQKKSLTL